VAFCGYAVIAAPPDHPLRYQRSRSIDCTFRPRRSLVPEEGDHLGRNAHKRFYRTAGRVELRPANPLLKSIFLDEGSGPVEIRGIVIGLIRKFES